MDEPKKNLVGVFCRARIRTYDGRLLPTYSVFSINETTPINKMVAYDYFNDRFYAHLFNDEIKPLSVKSSLDEGLTKDDVNKHHEPDIIGTYEIVLTDVPEYLEKEGLYKIDDKTLEQLKVIKKNADDSLDDIEKQIKCLLEKHIRIASITNDTVKKLLDIHGEKISLTEEECKEMWIKQ